MKPTQTLINVSLGFGIASLSIWVIGLLIARLAVSDQSAPPAIMSPRTFVQVALSLIATSVAGIGLLIALLGAVLGSRGKILAWALLTNATGCAPIAFAMLWRAL